jgi:hypothetical protein
MVKRRQLHLLLPLLLLNAAAITSVASFAAPNPLSSSTAALKKSLHQSSLHGSPLKRRVSSKLHVATDIAAELDMPELGNDGVYHIMDERQYK